MRCLIGCKRRRRNIKDFPISKIYQYLYNIFCKLSLVFDVSIERHSNLVFCALRPSFLPPSNPSSHLHINTNILTNLQHIFESLYHLDFFFHSVSERTKHENVKIEGNNSYSHHHRFPIRVMELKSQDIRRRNTNW